MSSYFGIIFILASCSVFGSAAAHVPVITEGPVSVTKLGGSNARFHCAGIGELLTWEVDGLILSYESIINRGISAVILSSSGTIQSNLTVPATSVNNGTTVRCAISVSLFNTPVVSNYSTLNVLPGIGQVKNLKFSPSFSNISWEPPLAAGILGTLSYYLTVTNVNIGQVIINTTTTGTSYPIDSPNYCTHYNASVTAFSVDLTSKGDTVDTADKTPGNNYRLKNVLSRVNVTSISNECKVSLTINIWEPNGLPCPDQRVRVETYPLSNTSDITNHPELAIKGLTSAVFKRKRLYLTSAVFTRKRFYIANVSIVGNKGVIETMRVNISTFDVQHCDVHTDNTYILVECTFAINSTAPGFVAIQDKRSGNYLSQGMKRRNNALTGFVNFTNMLLGEYSLEVFDQMGDFGNNQPAFRSENLKIGVNTVMQTPSPSFTVPSHNDAESSFKTPSVTPVSTTPFPYGFIIIVFAVFAFLISFGLLILTVTLIYIKLRTRKDCVRICEVESGMPAVIMTSKEDKSPPDYDNVTATCSSQC